MQNLESYDRKKLHDILKKEVESWNSSFTYLFKSWNQAQWIIDLISDKDWFLRILFTAEHDNNSFREEYVIWSLSIDSVYGRVESNINSIISLDELLKWTQIDVSSALNDAESNSLMKKLSNLYDEEWNLYKRWKITFNFNNTKATIWIDWNEFKVWIRHEGRITSPRGRYYPSYTFVFTSPLIQEDIFIRIWWYDDDWECLIMNYRS